MATLDVGGKKRVCYYYDGVLTLHVGLHVYWLLPLKVILVIIIMVRVTP